MDIKYKGSPKVGLFGATLGFFIGFAALSLFGPTVKFLKEVIKLDEGLAGLLISIPSLSGSLLRIPFSAMVEKDGGRKPFLILLTLSLIGILGIWGIMIQPQETIISLFPLLLFFGILGGCGIATFSVGVGQTSYWFPQKGQGTALGIYGGVANMAPGLFALLLTTVTIPFLGLSGSYLAWFVFLAVGILVYWITGSNAWYFQLRKAGKSPEEAKDIATKKGQELFPKGTAIQSLAISAKQVKTWLMVIIYFGTFGGFMAMTVWLTKFGMGYFGWDLASAGILTALYSVGTSLARVIGGPISDKIGGIPTTFGSLILALIGSAMVALMPPGTFTLVGIGLMALGMGVGNAAIFKLVPQFIPTAVGGAAGWIGGLGSFGGFVIPLVLALILSQNSIEPLTGFSQGFWVFAGIFALSLLILVGLSTRKKEAK